jgi:hypothetical protein
MGQGYSWEGAGGRDIEESSRRLAQFGVLNFKRGGVISSRVAVVRPVSPLCTKAFLQINRSRVPQGAFHSRRRPLLLPRIRLYMTAAVLLRRVPGCSSIGLLIFPFRPWQNRHAVGPWVRYDGSTSMKRGLLGEL